MVTKTEQPTNMVPGALQLYLDEINAIARLSHAEERELGSRVQAGDEEAKQRFILANLRLVVAVAKGYSTTELELLDHIQNGYFGLVKAVEHFDPGRNIHFATYAMAWIRQAITRRSQMSSRLIHLPEYIQDQLRVLDRVSEAWSQLHGTEPPIWYLANQLGVEASHIQLLQRARGSVASLDSRLAEDEESLPLAGCIADPSAEMAYMEVEGAQEDEEVLACLRRAFSCLTEREQTVIRLYFGLGCDAVPSHARVGGMIGVSRSQVRMILLKALDKLRKACQDDGADLRESQRKLALAEAGS